MGDAREPLQERPRIRPCRRDEIGLVLDVWVRADAHPTVTDDADSIQLLMTRDPDALLVAESAGRILGTLIAAWDGWRGTFHRLAVVPEWRRQGIARLLVEAGERRLRARGARRLAALIVPSDAPAVAFWESAGYDRQEGRLRFVKNLGAD